VIITVTANPSVDRTIEVDRLISGRVLRAAASRVDAGGKGVNVARALAANGHKAIAVVVCGGAEGAHLSALLDGSLLDLQVRTVEIAGALRSNITVVEADGTTTKLNEAGPPLSAGELESLAAATVDAAEAEGADWVVLSGSLPPGSPAGWYADVLRRLGPTGCQVAVDSSGPALAAAVEAGPDLIKPNREELAELSGHPITSVTDAVSAASLLLEKGVRSVLVSLGADGAVLAGPTGTWHASVPAMTTRSSVGAGDALLAGFLASGASGSPALVEAVAWGSAAASLPGSRMPTSSDIDRTGIRLTHLEGM
jgi:1-phosphofructokinase